MPFWSRRIGLYNEVTVPLQVGTKESGRVGETSFGVLAARTGAVAGLVPATDMGVVRVKRNVLGESSVGFIGTAGDPTGAPGSWLAGVDALLASSHVLGDKNAQLGLWGMTLDGRNVTGSKTAAGVSLFYPNDTWNNFLGYRRVGDGFQPALGFVPRPGVQQRSEEHTSELQSLTNLVCRLLLEKKKRKKRGTILSVQRGQVPATSHRRRRIRLT